MSGDASELTEAFDMEQYLDSQGIDFKKSRGSSGPQLNVKECPACGNRKWKVYLNAETGLGNCFACDKGYNKLTFVQAHGDMNWKDTFAYVKESLREQGWRPKVETVVAVDPGAITLPSSFPLPTNDDQNLKYLEDRGITKFYAKYFHLRYCAVGWWNYVKEDGSQGGQKFDNRVIIPVYDLDGVLKTFQGRDLTDKEERKYLFPKGLPGTGRFLLNGQSVQGAKRVAMGEGFFDIAALKIAFDDNPKLRDVVPVGSFGKHLSYGSADGNDQLGRFIQLKRAGTDEVTIMWDGEEKALQAALDASKLLRSIGLRARIALLPAGKDPNEISRQEVYLAFNEAQPYTSALAIKWGVRNPYK